jgi:hypothetical protein
MSRRPPAWRAPPFTGTSRTGRRCSRPWGGSLSRRPGERLQAGRLEEVAVAEAFERAVRAPVAVGDYLVVVSRESARPDPAEFERRVASPLRGLIERAQSLGDVRQDLSASWLMESLIGIVVSGLQTRPSLGVEETVAGITSLFLDGARLQQRRFEGSEAVPG